MTTVLGLVAAVLTTGAWLPQLVRTWRSRSCDDISWGYLATSFVGFCCWLAYGVVLTSLPIIAANVVSLSLVGSLCALKARVAS